MSAEEMKYGILGDDQSTEREKLEKYTGQVGWDYLREHYQNGVLFFVDDGLELTVVGEALANDRAEEVQKWLKAGDLVKIEELHAAQWEGSESGQEFEALVVSPFVLCRPVPNEGKAED